jgi:hypothetical protein
MKYEVSIPCSQELATGPYHEQNDDDDVAAAAVVIVILLLLLLLSKHKSVMLYRYQCYLTHLSVLRI